MLLQWLRVPTQDGDGGITVPDPSNNQGVSSIWNILKDIANTPYFWPFVGILILFAGLMYVWKNYPVVRYVVLFIAGIVAASYSGFAIFRK